MARAVSRLAHAGSAAKPLRCNGGTVTIHLPGGRPGDERTTMADQIQAEYATALAELRVAERTARLIPTTENLREVSRLSAIADETFKRCRRPVGIGNRP